MLSSDLFRESPSRFLSPLVATHSELPEAPGETSSPQPMARAAITIERAWRRRSETATPADRRQRRAVEIEHRRFGSSGKPLAVLLQARMHAFAGDDAAARALWQEIHERQRQARADQLADALFFPSEEVLLAMVDLATRDASDAEWNALRERADRASVEQELIEVVELRGRAALHRGRLEEAERILLAALEVASRIPNIMEGRIRRALPKR